MLQRLRTGSFSDTLMTYVRNKILQDFDSNLTIPDFWTAKLAEQDVKRQPPVNILSVRDAIISLTKKMLLKERSNILMAHWYIFL